MADGSLKKWGFQVHQDSNTASTSTIETSNIASIGAFTTITDNVNKDDPRPIIRLGHGDPSPYPSFRTTAVAEEAIVDAVRSTKYNSYAPFFGVPAARSAVADYLNRDLPYKLSPDDVYITLGCKHAIQVILTALVRPGANILLPRPGWPFYKNFSRQNNLEVRLFDLLPEKGWEVDLDAVEALADENTTAIVIINPGNPCGNVFTRQHLQNIAETARKLGIMVISDEVYDHLTFGSTPFVRMGVFATIVPVVTVGSLSKRWIVPGWRLGWLVACDPNGILQTSGIIDSVKRCLQSSSSGPTVLQGAVPQILEETEENFFSNIIGILRGTADACYNGLKETHCLTCPKKPEASMFIMVKLNPSLLEDISDDMEFSLKLAKEESVVVLPGTVLEMKNWLRITFAVEPSSLEDGLGRIKAFCHRHAKKQ